MKLCELIQDEKYHTSTVIRDLEIQSLSVSAQEIDDKTLQFIYNKRTENEFKNQAHTPAAVVCNTSCELPDTVNVIRVDNVREIMAVAYSRFYEIDYNSMTFIGITGTNGKTSTATFIRQALTDRGMKVGFVGTGSIACGADNLTDTYYSMTTPDPWVLYPAIRKMQDQGCKAVVMEVSSHALSLDKVAPIIFDYAVFTNMSEEHLDFHENMEDYFAAKMKLLRKCKKAVFNIDNAYCRRAVKEFDGEKITAGILWRGDVWATHINNKGFSGVEYMYRTASYLFKMTLQTAGIHNIYNSMLAAAVCTDMELKPCDIKKSFSSIKCISGRFEIIKKDITVIIDYAHTAAALEFLAKEIREAKLPTEGFTIVFGCGGERDKEKRPKMASIAEKYADFVIVTADNERREALSDILSDIVSGFSKDAYTVIEDRAEAIRRAILSAKVGDVVAVVGKGNEHYRIDSEGYHDFDEKEIIEKALLERGVLTK